MLYFAYGSNMDPQQMARRCPGSRSLGKALLPGYRLTFTWDSVRWGGGVGHVVADPASEVWGVLWDLTQEHLDALDVYEQVADGVYIRGAVTVRHDEREREALIYLATDVRDRKPSRRYLRALVRGALAHDFPPAYVEGLRVVRDRPVPGPIDSEG